MNTLFFGTPQLAVPYLQLLSQQSNLMAVVTSPDEPSGRGQDLHAPPVKEAALLLNKPVLQPTSLKDPELIAQLKSFQPELAIVVAYGKLLPLSVLQIPKHGFINVHFSLLPAYRGAAPMQRALMEGEKLTGVSLFWLEEGMDTGPIFLQKTLPILESDDGDSLREKLVPLGVDALREVLTQVGQGVLTRKPQTGPISLAHSLKKEEGKIDWNKPAQKIVNLIRGTHPWPGAFTFVRVGDKSQRLKVLKAKVVDPVPEASSAQTGAVVGLESGGGFIVKCSQDFLQILHVQPEGKRPMPAWDFWQGARLKIGDKLG